MLVIIFPHVRFAVMNDARDGKEHLRTDVFISEANKEDLEGNALKMNMQTSPVLKQRLFEEGSKVRKETKSEEASEWR